MKIRKYLLIAGMLFLFVTASALAPDCFAGLTLNTNAALLEYAEDMAWCDDNAPIGLGVACETEAFHSFNQNIDNALAGYDKCCCTNSLPCCMP